ncbi:hypothetical protein Cgig2_014392 [Carnegiea gigantea]|uniref:RNase H type-1 domain-containing protein n=1 Tax=Carnegiea gigantea TaxID=171969 RepID=A0A9Q1K010_9CARY|nr:hypothetical protein Cgig2_014392 [Carnegiea gigantea]
MEMLGKRAIAYVHSFRDQQTINSSPSPISHPSTWTSPMAGYVKLNFDGICIGRSFSGWRFAVRDHDGNILLAGVKHMKGATAVIIEDVRACLYTLKCTYSCGFRSVIIEGDNLQLIQMLKSRSPTDSLISFFLKDRNRVAHDLTHWQPICLEGRLWTSDVLDTILARAMDDMYIYVNDNLI